MSCASGRGATCGRFFCLGGAGCGPDLVARDGGVNHGGPVIDAAGEGLGVLETLLTEPHGDVERTGPVVAEDDDRLIGVEFLVGAGGDVPHRHGEGTGDGGGLELPGLADVEQKGWMGLLACGNEGVD